jgi:hypothetical protein
VVTLPCEERQRAGAKHFEIVGMGVEGEDMCHERSMGGASAFA